MSGFPRVFIYSSFMSLLLISGCVSKGDEFYKHQSTIQPLEVPPNLTLPETDNGFDIPDIGDVERKRAMLENGALIKLAKDGKLRWLEIAASPDIVWAEVKNYWTTNKVQLKWQNVKLGLMETHWITNYDNDNIQDRYRIRIEPGAKPNTSEVTVSHRSQQETMIEGQVLYGWTKNFSDPELEIEVLGELLSYLGLGEERKQALLDDAKQKADSITLDLTADIPHIVMSEPDDRSWRFVMQAIDRMDFTVIERDKKLRWLDVRIDAALSSDFTPGFALSDADREIYRVKLTTKNKETRISVLNSQGQPDRSSSAQKFLQELRDYL